MSVKYGSEKHWLNQFGNSWEEQGVQLCLLLVLPQHKVLQDGPLQEKQTERRCLYERA